MILVLLLAAVLLAYANGANDNFKATATLYGSDSLSYKQSLGLATFAQIAGSIASVLLAGGLLKAFGGRGLVPSAVVGDPVFLAAVGLGAASTVLVATRAGIPVSTTHALIGGLVGGGLALAPSEIAWNALGAKYFVPLLLSPLLAMGAAAILYPMMRSLRKALHVEATSCMRVGDSVDLVDVNPDGTAISRRSGLELIAADGATFRRIYQGRVIGISAQRLVDSVHTFSAFALGFARGLNDTPKVLALLVAAGWSGINPRVSLIVIAIAMATGGLLHSRRVAETMSHKITSMNRGQGVLANGVSSTLVIGASLLGSPVSTTHISTGALFGIGIWNESADWRVAGGIALAWVATLPLGAIFAAVAARALGAL